MCACVRERGWQRRLEAKSLFIRALSWEDSALFVRRLGWKTVEFRVYSLLRFNTSESEMKCFFFLSNSYSNRSARWKSYVGEMKAYTRFVSWQARSLIWNFPKGCENTYTRSRICRSRTDLISEFILIAIVVCVGHMRPDSCCWHLMWCGQFSRLKVQFVGNE